MNFEDRSALAAQLLVTGCSPITAWELVDQFAAEHDRRYWEEELRRSELRAESERRWAQAEISRGMRNVAPNPLDVESPENTPVARPSFNPLNLFRRP